MLRKFKYNLKRLDVLLDAKYVSCAELNMVLNNLIGVATKEELKHFAQFIRAYLRDKYSE